jgi:hypothetical protein
MFGSRANTALHVRKVFILSGPTSTKWLAVQVQLANASNLARIKVLLGELDQAHQAHNKELVATEARMADMRQDFHGRIEEARAGEAAARRDVAELQASVSQQLFDAERRIQQADARSNAVCSCSAHTWDGQLVACERCCYRDCSRDCCMSLEVNAP